MGNEILGKGNRSRVWTLGGVEGAEILSGRALRLRMLNICLCTGSGTAFAAGSAALLDIL